MTTNVSFEQCFRDEFAGLVAFGVSMTGQPETAKELAQETFVRAHRNWSVVGDYEQPVGWLRRTMSNLLVDHHRAATAERRRTERQYPPHQPGTEHIVTADIRWAELLAVLPLRQRAIVSLCYAHDVAVVDIAEQLDIAENTVKSALAKARHRLRRHLETNGELP